MSDRFAAKIAIGGQISRTERLYPNDPDDDTTILQGLIGALSEDYASHEYGGAKIENNCTDLDNYMEDGVLNFRNDQAVNGEFSETERFCIEHNIAFDRWSDHYCEYNGENVYWREGMAEAIITLCDSGGNELIGGNLTRMALSLLIKFRATSNMNFDFDFDLDEAIKSESHYYPWKILPHYNLGQYFFIRT